jgi:hypothetical protein
MAGAHILPAGCRHELCGIHKLAAGRPGCGTSHLRRLLAYGTTYYMYGAAYYGATYYGTAQLALHTMALLTKALLAMALRDEVHLMALLIVLWHY